jgi:hypothetical protein
VSPSKPFLVDKANSCLVGGREDSAPRAIGLRKLLHLLNKTGAPFFFAPLLCVTVLLAPVGIAFFVWGFLAFRHEYRLHRHGRVILGEVQSFGETIARGHEQGPEGIVGAPTSWVVPWVKFTFPTPDGRVFVNWASIEPWKSSDLPPRPGQLLAVLYLDDENYQVL